MKFAPIKLLLLGVCLTATPCFAQMSGKPDGKDPAPNPAAPTPAPQVPPAPRVDPEDSAHRAMVEEQERRDREEQDERDRDDQARQNPARLFTAQSQKA